MNRLLALSSVRIGLYIAAAGGVSYFISPAPATLTLAVIGGLVFTLGTVGPRLPFARQLPYALILLSVSALILGLGGVTELAALFGRAEPNSVLGPVMRLVAAALGGLLFAVALYALQTPEDA